MHECGAGLGLPGLAVAMTSRPARVVLTDNVEECLSAMRTSARLNSVEDVVAIGRYDWREAVRTSRPVGALASAAPQPLQSQNAEPPISGLQMADPAAAEFRCDVVICSDVVFAMEIADWLPVPSPPHSSSPPTPPTRRCHHAG